MTPEFYGVECNEYSPVVTEEKFAKNNKLLTSYAANKAANLIKNGSFEANSSWKYLSGASYAADSSKAFAGNRSMKMSRTSKGSDTDPAGGQIHLLGICKGRKPFGRKIRAEHNRRGLGPFGEQLLRHRHPLLRLAAAFHHRDSRRKQDGQGGICA